MRSVIWPEAFAQNTSGLSTNPSVEKSGLVVFVDSRPWNKQEAELFDKMRAAMKLSQAQTKILFAGPGEMTQKSVELMAATCVIFFSPELATQAQNTEILKSLRENPSDGMLQMTTFGPRELISNPQLKKQTWDDLQKVMKKLK